MRVFLCICAGNKKGRTLRREQNWGAVEMSSSLELLRAEELARRLDVKPATIRAWSRKGLIPSVRVTPKVIRFDVAAVLDALAHSQQNGGHHV
jgi:hypothetical protein